MPATASRIGFIMQEWRRVTVRDEDVRTIYGALSRESDDPVETFFDDIDDAQSVAIERQALLSVGRRRFSVEIVGTDDAVAIAEGNQIVSARYVDTERASDRPMIVAEVTVNLERERASLTLWG